MSIGEASSGSAGSIRITAGKLDLKEAEDDAETTPSGGAIALTSGKSTYGESGCITVRTADGGRSDDEYRTNSGSIHLATGTATGAGGSIIMEAGAGYGDTGCGGSLYSPQEIISTKYQRKIMPAGTSTSALALDLRKPRVVRWLSSLAAESWQQGGSPSLQVMRAKRTVRLDLYK